MPVNNFSVGKDVTVDIYDPLSGGVQLFSGVNEFSAKQETAQNSFKPGIDGVHRPLVIPGGWSGTIGFDRRDSRVDDYFAGQEARYFAGINILTAGITQTVQEADGSLSQYRFEQVLFAYDEAGTWKGDDSVSGKLSFKAAFRKKVS